MEDAILDNELGRFFQLARDNPLSPPEMWSPLIDLYWHTALKDDAKYKSLCRKNADTIIYHKEDAGFGEISWINEYERRFGALSSVWFQSREGRLDIELMEEYLWTGDIYASWDCRPLIEK
jgi:hypothetical protein